MKMLKESKKMKTLEDISQKANVSAKIKPNLFEDELDNDELLEDLQEEAEELFSSNPFKGAYSFLYLSNYYSHEAKSRGSRRIVPLTRSSLSYNDEMNELELDQEEEENS